MTESLKRKDGPQGAQQGGPKKSKGGVAGRWKTPLQEAKKAERIEMGTTLAVGDQGIWVTFARGMNQKVVREMREVCAYYGEQMYGIKPPGDDDETAEDGDKEEEEELDIEASIQKELEALKQKPSKPKKRGAFMIVKADLDCVLFIKTMAPVDPVEFVRRVCLDARACASPGERRLRYVNRLTPVTDTDRSTEAGILKVARSVLQKELALKEPEEGKEEGTSEESKVEEEKPHHTYALRPTLRAYNSMKSIEVINKIAAIVSPQHKVNLLEPDKVVLVEIFQLFCGVSVVDGMEWERLKRYNVNELYRLAFEEKGINGKDINSRVKGKPRDDGSVEEKPKAS